MSNSGLVFQSDDAHAAHGFYNQVIELIRIGAAASERNRLAPVDGLAFGIRLDESRVTSLLGPAGDLIDRLVPGDVLPMVGTWTSHSRFQYPPIVLIVLLQRSALRTESAAVDRVIGISFHVDDLGRHVLRLVTDGMDDHPATDRAVRAGATRLGRSGDLEAGGLRHQRPRIETEDRNSHGAYDAGLEEC